jgi:V8-like Glu-specific endopeptidase
MAVKEEPVSPRAARDVFKVSLESPFLKAGTVLTQSRDERRPDASRLTIQSPFERAFEHRTPRFEPEETVRYEGAVAWERETAAGLQKKLVNLSFFPHSWELSHREVPLQPVNVSPGIYDGPDKFKTSTLQPFLDAAMKKLKLTNVKVALVDLTKGSTPEFAGFHHRDQVTVVGIPKMAAMLAAFQLRHDLQNLLKDTGAGSLDALFSAIRDKWVDTQIVFKTKPEVFTRRLSLQAKLVLLDGGKIALSDPKSPQLDRIFAAVPAGNPVAVGFSSTGEDEFRLRALAADAFIENHPGPDARRTLLALGFEERLQVMMDGAVPGLVSDLIASSIVRDVGYPYMASTLLQSGLYDPNRGGGLWLGSDYGHGKWRGKASIWKGALAGGSAQSATAGALAAFLTFLAQDALVDPQANAEMRARMQQDILPGPRSVVGFKEALEHLPNEGSLTTMVSIGGHADREFDDCAFVERTADKSLGLRYVAVGLGARSGEELKALALELDNCILANNGLPLHELGEYEMLALESDGRTGGYETVTDPESPAEASFADQETGKFGKGSSIRVSNTQQIPFRWICNIAVARRIKTAATERRTGLAPDGSGVLISPCHILTAAHVLRSVEKDDRGTVTERHEAETVRITLAADEQDEPFGHVDAMSWAVHPRWNPEGNTSQYDYAVITLDRCVGDEQFASLGQKELCFWGSVKCGSQTFLDTLPASLAKTLVGREVATAGYPQSRKKQMWCFKGNLFSGSPQQDAVLTKEGAEDWARRTPLYYLTADAERGQSGSPVWILDNGRRYLIGILIQAGEERNTVVAMNDRVVRQVQSWLKKSAGTGSEKLLEEWELDGEETGHDNQHLGESDLWHGAQTGPDETGDVAFEEEFPIPGEVQKLNREADFDRLHPGILEFPVGAAEQELEAPEVGEEREVGEDEQPVIIEHNAPKTPTRQVSVGERIELDLTNTAFAARLDKVTWTIPGRVVRGYDGTVHNAKLFELTEDDRKRPKISFFWVDAADGRTVRATILTKSGGVEVFVAVFDVKGPTMNTFTGTPGETQIEERGGLKAIRFGKLTVAPGITWKWKITMPSGHAGYIKDVQTVLVDRSQILSLEPGGKETRKLVWRHPKKTDPHVQLDGASDGKAAYTSALYEPKHGAGEEVTSGKRGTSDSPHTELPSLGKTVSVNDQFTYYFMFKPATDKPQDAIWVPVAKAKWFWKAAATKSGGKWNVSPAKMKPSIEMTTGEFPMYETNAAENEWEQVSP